MSGLRAGLLCSAPLLITTLIVSGLIITGLGTPAYSQGKQLASTTQLRLDAVDTSKGKKGELVLFGSFLNEFGQSVPALKSEYWTIQLDGEPLELDPESLTVKSLKDSDEGVYVVLVAMACCNMMAEEEQFAAIKKGIEEILNGLGSKDQSAVVLYQEGVLKTSSLNPSHEEAVVWLGQKGEADGTGPQFFSAIEQALKFFPPEFGTLNSNRHIIVISDGDDVDRITDRSKTREKLKALKTNANAKKVKVHSIGLVFEGQQSETLANLRTLSGGTGGVYRESKDFTRTRDHLSALKSQLLEQNVLYVKTNDFEGEKDITYTLSVKHPSSGKVFNALAPVVEYTPEVETNLWRNILLISGGVVGLGLFGWLGMILVRRMGNRDTGEVFVDAGEETRECEQCGNTIPVDWMVCKYCEALPHKGRLTVISTGDLNGRVWFIKESLVNIGRSDGNHIMIPDTTVSKRHAGIKVDNGRFELADFGSTSGVLVNGQRITKRFLKDGDAIHVGGIELEFKLKKS